MERVNNICKRVAFIKIPFLRMKMFKYPKKKEFCIQIEYRIRQTWGVRSPNGLWKTRSFWFHYQSCKGIHLGAFFYSYIECYALTKHSIQVFVIEETVMRFTKRDRHLILSERIVSSGNYVVIDTYIKKGATKKWLTHYVVKMSIERAIQELQQRGWR